MIQCLKEIPTFVIIFCYYVNVCVTFYLVCNLSLKYGWEMEKYFGWYLPHLAKIFNDKLLICCILLCLTFHSKTFYLMSRFSFLCWASQIQIDIQPLRIPMRCSNLNFMQINFKHQDIKFEKQIILAVK